MQARLAPGARPVVGNALDAESFATAVPRGATVVHLVGTPHPGPGKGAEFVRVDLASIRATAAATVTAAAKHLVYISVAQPASVMRAYIAARTEGEALVRASGIPATILRPWYVLGPGHYWPYLLVPLYGLLRMIPATRPHADRLGLVTRSEMISALMHAIAAPPVGGSRIADVPGIRAARKSG